MSVVITVDGVSASGKSVLAAGLADHFSLPYLNTGKIYRSLALHALKAGVAQDDVSSLCSLISSAGSALLSVDPADIESEIIADFASCIAVIAEVRGGLLLLQRNFATDGVVADGRDTGSVVFCNADYKFYVTASARVRAKRRIKITANDTMYDEELNELIRCLESRDSRDMTRKIAPLVVPENAFIIDNTNLNVVETLQLALGCIAGDC